MDKYEPMLIDANEIVTTMVMDEKTKTGTLVKIPISDALDKWTTEGCPKPIEAESICSICKSSATGFDFKPLKHTEERKNCPMRHENGNCLAIGGFCLAVNDEICYGLHNAYNKGVKAEPKRDEVVVNEACLNCELDCVEVVRCHDCRNYEEAKNSCNGFCKEWNTSTYTWDYCSRGERKDDEKK